MAPANRIVLFGLAAVAPAASVLVRSPLVEPQGEEAAGPDIAEIEAFHKKVHKEKEMEIYRKHWWPLEPLPYHHPGTNPTLAQLKVQQSYEENYTRYWRSLPPLRAQPLLLNAQRAPYFKVRDWRSSPKMQPIPGGDKKLYFICHHKTGENLHSRIKEVLSQRPQAAKYEGRIEDAYEPWTHGQTPVYTGDKVVHMVRDPVDIIASGYRYHQNKWGSEIWSWGHNKLQDPQCFECDDEDHDAMFEACNNNCTYFELLNRLDEISGAATEALSARISLTSMASFMALMADNPNALHLSMGLIKANPEKTVACLLKFLGLEGYPGLAEKMVQKVTYVQDPDHVTSGLYDNLKVKAFLKTHDAWGPDFREVEELMASIFRRQAEAYGCPALEAK